MINQQSQDKTKIEPIVATKNKVYGYMTPEIKNREGMVKVGETTRDVDERIREQVSQLGLDYDLLWKRLAQRKDRTWFSDKDLHRYFIDQGIERVRFEGAGASAQEWFDFKNHPEKSEELVDDYIGKDKYDKSDVKESDYILRPEQAEAVNKTLAYYKSTLSQEGREFLWNAKPRFGKTLSSYDFMRRISAKNTLIVTNRPAIANSWLEDFDKFIGWQEDNIYFVSDTDALAGKTMTREEFTSPDFILKNKDAGMVCFISLQDLKGSKHFGGDLDKLGWVKGLDWDLLIVDEAHEGVDTYKTDRVFEGIQADFTLHLSGTPFKALATGKFSEEQIYNWTYLDEQEAKHGWDSHYLDTNPYEDLPELSLFTYQMSEMVRDQIQEGMQLTEDTNIDYAFNLNEFFSTDPNGKFIHEEDVKKFLDRLTTGHMPFSEEEYRKDLDHTFWLLPGVKACKALEKLLNNHPVFKNYKTVLAAGDGVSLEDEGLDSDTNIAREAYDSKKNEKSYDKVKRAIAKHDKTITLSCGQLTTGVTVPEWTGVLMLNNITSPALYFQAAFRAQNPYKFEKDGRLYRKDRAYVFDFSPDRTLVLYDQYANNLSAGGPEIDGGKRKENIRILLNYFPVIAEDEEGRMEELGVDDVILRPNRIRAQEVVRNGFMSNLLFKNIGNIFSAPQEVRDILNALPKEEGKRSVSTDDPIEERDPMVDEDGEVDIDPGHVEETQESIFGKEIYLTIDPEDSVMTILTSFVDHIDEEEAGQKYIDQLDLKKGQGEKDKGDYKKSLKAFIEEKKASWLDDKARAEEAYQDQLDKAEARKQEDLARLEGQEDERARKESLKEIDQAYEKGLAQAQEARDQLLDEAKKDFQDQVNQEVRDLQADLVQGRIEEKERTKKNKEESDVRDRLRGFTRTIPSALMAYGDRETRLENFDEKISDQDFLELTSISKEAFRLLRDGWEKRDEEGRPILKEDGSPARYEGFFNGPVFDASVQEFFNKKEELADYHKTDSTRTIFDYIPLQETNQKFTPVEYVRLMVDALEDENPGIYSDPDLKFLDPYAKSGLFVTEIARRLYQGLKKVIPDEKERTRHIFEDQVYALAPTNIIYRIAKSHIYDGLEDISTANLVNYDLTKDVKNGTMQEAINKIYGWDDKMRFDVIIGNPPYQEENIGESRQAPPIYDKFMDASYEISDRVMFITPARFLFNAGATRKSWNEKMLADKHLSVIYFTQDSGEVFPNTDIKGGIAVTLRDTTKEKEPIGIFTHFDELRTIKNKVAELKEESFSTIIYGQNTYQYTDRLYKEYPEAESMVSKGHKYDLTTNTFERLSIVYFDEKPEDGYEYIRIYGRMSGNRMYKWIRKDFVKNHENLYKYKVFVPKSNGTGALGEVLSTPLIGEPLIGHTQTFISIGKFENKFEAEACLKYVRSKFARTMLGILKLTQDNPAPKWKLVPLQDFTENSDIDWSQSVANIDLQLYKKYDLSQEEIDFIEDNVHEME